MMMDDGDVMPMRMLTPTVVMMMMVMVLAFSSARMMGMMMILLAMLLPDRMCRPALPVGLALANLRGPLQLSKHRRKHMHMWAHTNTST